MKLTNSKEIGRARIEGRGPWAVYKQHGSGGLLSEMYLISDWYDTLEEASAEAKTLRRNYPENNGWNAVVDVTSYERYWYWKDRR